VSRRTGWLPDPPKLSRRHDPHGDLDFGDLGLGTFPDSADLRPLVAEVLDQGALGSCVANAGMQAVRMSHMRQLLGRVTSGDELDAITSNPPPLGSRLFGYYLARATHHTTGIDSGTYLRALFEVLNSFGFPPEGVWPYSVERFTQMPPTRAIRAAYDQMSPTTYHRIFSSGYDKADDIKRALAGGYAVPFGIDVNQRFVDGTFDPSVPLGPMSNTVGGHAMVFVGYDGDVFDVLNSWGTGFGDGGYFKVSAEFVLETRDDWAIEYAPTFSE
jgi:hypothetical protein